MAYDQKAFARNRFFPGPKFITYIRQIDRKWSRLCPLSDFSVELLDAADFRLSVTSGHGVDDVPTDAGDVKASSIVLHGR